MNCAKCDHPNPAKAKFCNNCGSPLAETSPGKVAAKGPNAKTKVKATRRGVAAGDSGVAVGGSVRGGVRINSPSTTVIKRSAPARVSPARAMVKSYLEWVIADCRPLRLKGIDPRAARPEAEPLELGSVFIDLNTDLRLPTKRSLAAHLARAKAETPELAAGSGGERDERRVSVLEALGCHREMVLLGVPGAGKSTMVQYVTLALAEARSGNRKALKRLGSTWRAGALLPVRVTLRQFAAELGTKTNPRAKDLWNFIARDLAAAGIGDQAGRWLKTEANGRGIFFLLDGLDETKEPAMRARVCAAAAEFMRTAGAKSRFLLTSRPYAWDEMVESQMPETCPPGLHSETKAFGELLSVVPAKYRVADLEPEQTVLFVERWYAALLARGWITVAADAEKKGAELKQAVRRADLRPLARNPLLLTLMATLHSNRTRLPDDRADLYHEVVELLLQRWNENIGADRGLLDALAIPTLKLNDLREVLEELAFQVHGRQASAKGQADIPEGDLVAALKPLLGGSADKAGLVLDYIEQRAGLLLGQGSRGQQRQFTFPHRTFQEFLAARYLSTRPDFEEELIRLAEDNPGHWREVLKLAARLATASRGVPVCDGLVNRTHVAEWLSGHEPTEADWRKAMLAGEQMLEIGLAAVVGNPRHNVVRQRIAHWLVALIESGALPAQERAEAGNVLAKLGDPRQGVVPVSLDELAAMEFCHVPPGDFWMGDEKPKKTSLDHDYWIGRHPVTVAQFELFVKAGGYQKERYWAEAKAAKFWQEGKVKGDFDSEATEGPPAVGEPFNLANHPVVGVSWYEANAYCLWLTEQWKERLPVGYGIELATGAEWEKAARGGEKVAKAIEIERMSDGLKAAPARAAQANPEPKRVYPWVGGFDANRVNCRETRIGTTNAVGCFPAGVSPCGALDMAGNVWEWSRDGHKGARVLRGGAFLVTSFVRCAFRDRYRPGDRVLVVGFRVVASPFSEL